MSYLQNQIQTRMEKKNLSIYALENKAGLKRSAVRNIIHGYSKKPSADVLVAIAEALDCTINDLTGQTSTKKFLPNLTTEAQSNPWNESLCIDAIKIISKVMKEKKLSLNFGEVMTFVAEIYGYSVAKKSSKIDKDFATWLISKS